MAGYNKKTGAIHEVFRPEWRWWKYCAHIDLIELEFLEALTKVLSP